MADCSDGEIQIGGKFPRRLLPELLRWLGEEYAFLNDGEDEKDLDRDSNGALSLEGSELPGGCFDGLETFLIANKIDFDRQASPSYYYDPHDVSYRNGEAWTSSREATDALRERIEEELSIIYESKDLEALREFIRRNGPPPPLEPFTIVDE